MLFPVFARAKEAARKVACLNNMHQVGLALSMYYVDYDSMLPSSALYGGGTRWDPSSFQGFAAERGQIGGSSTQYDNKWSWPELLYPLMKNRDIIWCPSDPQDHNAPAAYVSYYYKAAVDAAWFGGPSGSGMAARREGDFEFPCDQIVFWEHNGWHWGDAGRGAVDGVSINVAYLDGHVASRRIAGSGYLPAENPPAPFPARGYGEPAWFNTYVGTGAAPSPMWDPRTCYDNLP